MISALAIAGHLGLHRFPKSFRGDCPACGYPRSFTVRAGRLGRPLLFCANGCDYSSLTDAINRRIGGAWMPPQHAAPEVERLSRERKQQAALRLWNGARTAVETIAERYFAGRMLPGLA